MDTIVTLTLNPALDKTAVVEKLSPDRKLRSSDISYEPGGGGINVSRAIRQLGGSSYAIYTKGGHTGAFFETLLEKEGVMQKPVGIEGITRENFMAVERSTERHYRFGMPGPELSVLKAQECIDLIKNHNPKPAYIVASGSLPPGLPDDFYAYVAQAAEELGAKFILDTSGNALKKGVQKAFLLKPNLGELSNLAGVDYVETEMVEKLASKLIDEGKTKIVAVSLGPGGALLVTRDIIEHIPSPTVRKKSVVGAGDSMVAAMVLSLAQGKSFREMIRRGVAAGAAATMTPGSELCKKEDADHLYDWIIKNSPIRE